MRNCLIKRKMSINKFIILFGFYCLHINVFLSAQTNIPSGPVSGTWTKSSSPYKIQGNISVPKDSTLTLEPGTVIEFQDNYALKVDGILKAEGKPV